MKKSSEIKTQIEQTNSRISELQPQFDEQLQTFEKTQQAFVSNKINLTEHHHEYSKLMLLETTIKSLLATAQRLELELKSALENEARQSVIAQMKTIAADARKGFNAFVARHDELDKAARRAIDALENFRGSQNTFAQNFRKLAPNVESPTLVTKYNRKDFDDVVAELREAGITKESFDLSVNPVLNLPPVEFGERLVTLAKEITNLKNHHADQTARDKARDKRSNELAEEREAEMVRLEIERLKRNAEKAEAASASAEAKKTATFQSI